MTRRYEQTVTGGVLGFGVCFRAHGQDLPPGGLEAVCLSKVRGGVFARLTSGQITRLTGDLALEITPGPIAALRTGDELLVKNPAGELRGKLASAELAQGLQLKLSHGQVLGISLDQISALSLLFRDTGLMTPGARFQIKSKSGNRYEGTVGQLLPDQRVVVELTTGRTVDLRLERLDLNTLIVPLAVDLELLRQGELTLAGPQEGGQPLVVPSLVQPDASSLDPESPDVSEELERERRSSARLKRELTLIMAERERLEREVREREKFLESEVWRGLATQRDLVEARKRLEELERKIGDEQEGGD